RAIEGAPALHAHLQLAAALAAAAAVPLVRLRVHAALAADDRPLGADGDAPPLRADLALAAEDVAAPAVGGFGPPVETVPAAVDPSGLGAAAGREGIHPHGHRSRRHVREDLLQGDPGRAR